MNSPLYEIAANVLEMPGILCEYGYWQMRVWGFTERDILHGTFAAASFGAFALCSAYYPERPPGAMAAFFLPPLERFTIRLHRQWWWKMTRIAVLFSILMYQAYILGRSIPLAFTPYLMQAQQAQVADPTRELANHGAQLDALGAWRKSIEDKNYPERMALLEQAVIRFEKRLDTVLQVAIAAVLPGFAWAIQQIFKMLMKQQNKGDD